MRYENFRVQIVTDCKRAKQMVHAIKQSTEHTMRKRFNVVPELQPQNNVKCTAAQPHSVRTAKEIVNMTDTVFRIGPT